MRLLKLVAVLALIAIILGACLYFVNLGPVISPTVLRSLRDSLRTLRSHPGDATALNEIKEVAKTVPETGRTRELKAGLILIYGLGEIQAGHARAGLDAYEYAGRAEFAGTAVSGIIASNVIHSTCTECQGQSKRTCEDCRGAGRCARCGGKGKIDLRTESAATPRRGGLSAPPNTKIRRLGARAPSGQKTMGSETALCTACGGSKRCQACSGSGTRSVDCRSCGSTGRVISMASVNRLQTAAVALGEKLALRQDLWTRVLYPVTELQVKLRGHVSADMAEAGAEWLSREFLGAASAGPTPDGTNSVPENLTAVETNGMLQKVGAVSNDVASIEKFYLRPEGGTNFFGPFGLREGERIGSGRSWFDMIDVKGQSFALHSRQTGATYGPFQCTSNSKVRLGKAVFTLVLVQIEEPSSPVSTRP